MAPPRIPEQITAHGLRFPVYQLGDGRLAFRDGTTGKVIKRQSIEKLKEAADKIAFSIVNAETAARVLTAEDRRIFIAARETLAPFNTSVDGLAREAAEAFAISGRVSLVELARFFVARNPSLQSAPPTKTILDELTAQLLEQKRSAIYLRDLKRDLTPFATAYPDIGAVTEREITSFLRTKTEISLRRRDNIRDAIVRLFSFAREQHYLPQDRKTAAEKVPRLDEGIAEVTTYTPAELKLLLHKITPTWRPWFILGAFAGLRTSEIFRLEWNAIKWEERVIAVGRRIARKIKISRKVPIQDNLFAWLAEYRDCIGALYPHQEAHGIGPTLKALESRHSRALTKLTAATGLPWESNALRHSYGSHRLAIIKSEPQLVVEMGNSISQVREHYHDPKTESEAKLYFDIRPDDADSKVLHLPLYFSA